MGALLHDVVEDTATNFDSIRKLTDTAVMSLVRGVTKRTGFKSVMRAFKEECRLHPESGVNCLYIKLADRFDNLRDNVNDMPLKVRRRYIRENTKLLKLCNKYEITFLVKELTEAIAEVKI